MALTKSIYIQVYKNLVLPGILPADQSIVVGVAITQFLTNISSLSLTHHILFSLNISLSPLSLINLIKIS